jgi:transcriptional regulator with XRE-family HTH domain
MYEGKSMDAKYPRIAEFMQGGVQKIVPQNGEPSRNQVFMISRMDYKNEVGRRIRAAREAKGFTLAEVSQRTDDVLTLKRINAYENGDRMPGPDEVVILAKALGQRAAYLMALDDTQIAISPIEEKLIRNWRTLPERERMEFYRQLEAMAMTYRDPIQDAVVERHLRLPPTGRAPRAAAHKRVKSR